MSNCPGCDSSSTTYTRCNPPVSTNCVFYQGKSQVCKNDETFTICKGDNMSDLQQVIFEKICTLIGDIDITTVQIPTCFYDAWNAEHPKESDKTLLELLAFMLNAQCEYQKSVDILNKLVDKQTGTVLTNIPVIDPYVNVCLACCSPSGCQTSVTLHLSEALQKIVDCICKTQAIANEALTVANNALYEAHDAMVKYNELVTKQCRQNVQLAGIITYLNNPTGLNAGLTFDYSSC